MKKIDELVKKLKIPEKKAEVEGLLKESAQSDFWQNSASASRKMQYLAGLQEEIGEIEKLKELFEKGKKEEIKKLLKKIELKTFLNGKHDQGDAILALHAGQGGVEAMDWTEMLLRMYLRFLEKKGWKNKLVEEIRGEEAGLKSAAIMVHGSYAYGYLKHEAGTHRLVRLSPFNADNLRQTSFSLIEVFPLLEEREVEVKNSDLEWQFFRASSQGGQNVQKVSSAVRLKHKPSNIVVTSQVERSQEQNRKIALQILKSRLWKKQEKERKTEEQAFKKGGKQASWGTQIRSYVLHPYHLVKDVRTGYETQDTQDILDGNLEKLIEAAIYKLS